MKYRVFFAAMVVVPCAVYAQTPAQSPREQALTAKLITEINNGLSCSTEVVTLQQQIQKLQAQIAEAKKAPEPKEKKK